MVNEACQDCPSENNENNLCSICNTGFYPIKGEKDKLLKNCYNSGTIPVIIVIQYLKIIFLIQLNLNMKLVMSLVKHVLQ